MNANFLIIRRSIFCKMLFVILCMFFFAGPELFAYTVDTARVDSSKDFDAFLEKCSPRERIILLQTLRALDDEIEDELFGKVKGLLALGSYTNDPDRAKQLQSQGIFLKPKTFNEVSPDTVLDALEKGYVELDYSQKAIRKELIWRRYNKLNYVWHSTKGIDYHRDILRWVAKKKDVEENQINKHSTYDLERAVASKYLEHIWNKLTREQRAELLAKIENATGGSVGDKVAIAAMSGGAAIAALGTTVALSGFAFYTTMSVVISTVAGWLGVTLPFAAYIGASTTVSVLAGPIGWGIAIVSIAGGAIWMGLPEDDTIAAFVIQVNQIKTSWISR